MLSLASSAPASGYSSAQRGFHWLMAVLIFGALALGIWTTQLPRGELRSDVLFIHKSIGVAVLGLVVLRFVVRLIAGHPAYREKLDRLSAIGSKVAHGLLYLLMLLMPLSGYMLSSAGGREIPFFGLFTVPSLAPQDKALAEGAANAHLVLAWAIGVLVALHVVAAFWHFFVKRDEVMSRMWPAWRPKSA